MKKYLLILFALFIAAGCSNNDSSDSNPATPIKTTVLMYIEGTTFEYPKVANIFFDEYTSEGIKTDAAGYTPANYMIKGMIENLNPENTKIVIQTGSTEPNMTWTADEIAAAGADPEKYYLKDWSEAKRWQITKDEGLKPLENKGSVCMNITDTNCVDINSGDTIGDFLTYGVQKYPADRYIVIFFSHGGGSILGFGSGTTLPEMQKAFNKAKTATNAEFDIIGFAACLMGTAEWMHGLSDYGKYYVASEETETGFPWLLGDITSGIAQNYTTEQLLETITSTYYQYSAKNGKQATNISAVDLKQVKALSSALGQLSNKIAEDYKDDPAKTFNNFYVALSRSNNYGEGAFGLYDLQAVINSLNDKTWYGLDYSSYNQNITDIISNSVKINKTSPFLSESYGISFYAPNFEQMPYFQDCNLTDLGCLVNLYSGKVSNFSDEYVSMLDNITEYGVNTEIFIDVSTIRKDGTKYSIDYTSNFAPSYNSTLELIRTYDDGTTRIGTVEGDYTITAVPDKNSDNYKYTITVDTGYEQEINANLFAIAPYGTIEYNPIQVIIQKSIDNFNAANTIAKTDLLLTREGETPNKTIKVSFRYSKENGKYIIHDTVFKDPMNQDELSMPFSFQAGDIITIPGNSSITGKAETNANLPSYTITCSSEKCVEFNIVPFEAVEIPKFRFNIKNIKNDYPYITAEQTTFN
ncbi:MAG: clostripain-related cysteine peptidase [Mucispirillum sp.]|nr:clostripain-related cysteine peptidase [Mucispirillum sp.]